MAAPIIITLGGALLRIASKQLPKYLDKGAKVVKKPTKSQMQKAKAPAQKKKLDAIPKKNKDRIPLRDKPKKRSGKFDTRDAAEKAMDEVEFEMDFGPDPDAEYTPRFSMDKFYASGGSVKGGSVKKRYSYGGRVAKYSIEKS